MSYCRASAEDSDVYVIRTGDGLECRGCSLPRKTAPWGVRFGSWALDWADAWIYLFVNLAQNLVSVLTFDYCNPPWALRYVSKKYNYYPSSYISKQSSFTCDTPDQMITHLLDHLTQGDKVPGRAMSRLTKETWDSIAKKIAESQMIHAKILANSPANIHVTEGYDPATLEDS